MFIFFSQYSICVLIQSKLMYVSRLWTNLFALPNYCLKIVNIITIYNSWFSLIRRITSNWWDYKLIRCCACMTYEQPLHFMFHYLILLINKCSRCWYLAYHSFMKCCKKLRKTNRALHEKSILSNYEGQHNVYVIFRRDYMESKDFYCNVRFESELD